MDRMESTYNEKTKSLKNSILSKYDEIFHAHTSGIERVNEKIMADCEKFLQDYKESCLQIEAGSKLLEQQDHELKKKEQKLLKEKKKLQLKKRMEIIDEEDEKIVRMKEECNEEQYRAVVRALNERNEYKPDCMEELWLYKEDRKVSLREGIDYVLQEWKIHKQPTLMY